MILEARSIPFSTPEAITKCVSPINTVCPEDRPERIRREVVEIGGKIHSWRTVEAAVHRLPDVFECPAGNDRIETKDQESS